MENCDTINNPLNNLFKYQENDKNLYLNDYTKDNINNINVSIYAYMHVLISELTSTRLFQIAF